VFDSWQGQELLSSPQRPDPYWGHPDSHPVGLGGFSPGVKREANHSLPCNAKVKNGGAIPPFPDMSSCRGTLLGTGQIYIFTLCTLYNSLCYTGSVLNA
jgi:hypothetical protein